MYILAGELQSKQVAQSIVYLPHTTFIFSCIIRGDGGPRSTVVKVLRYKSEGRWFDPRLCREFFIDINSSDRTMALGLTQPLTEMSIGSISWGQMRPLRKADNLTTILCRCHEIWEP
jgi:hypothetical protein